MAAITRNCPVETEKPHNGMVRCRGSLPSRICGEGTRDPALYVEYGYSGAAYNAAALVRN